MLLLLGLLKEHQQSLPRLPSFRVPSFGCLHRRRLIMQLIYTYTSDDACEVESISIVE
jgi:hypothetical protein